MQVSLASPVPQLAAYVPLIWTFESRGGIPADDRRLIVPDGRAKIIIPYKNAVMASTGGRNLYAAEHQLFLVGIQTKPATIASTAADTGTIGIEVSAKGLYHLFDLGMNDIANKLVGFNDLFGRWGLELQSRIAEVDEPHHKLILLQRSLTELLQKKTKDFSLLDYTMDEIVRSRGTIAVHAIQRRIGYSRRYLDMLFKEHVGVSPKAYASIVRFQDSYRTWMHSSKATFGDSGVLDSYYDQSHFIKSFRRFTGYAPQLYRRQRNEFGRAFERAAPSRSLDGAQDSV